MVLTKTDEYYESSQIDERVEKQKNTGHDGIRKEILKCCLPIKENI